MKQYRGYLVIGFVALIVSANFVLPRAAARSRIQNFTVKITERGFEPDNRTLRRGVQARITLLRTTDQTCAKEVVLPDFGIKRELPLNQPVVITITPGKKGGFAFTCGMNMMRGNLIVQ